MLSTAMLPSATAKRGFSPIWAQYFRTCTAVVVLPVPGGPCMMVHRCSKVAPIARFWDSVQDIDDKWSRHVDNFSSLHGSASPARDAIENWLSPVSPLLTFLLSPVSTISSSFTFSTLITRTDLIESFNCTWTRWSKSFSFDRAVLQITDTIRPSWPFNSSDFSPQSRTLSPSARLGLGKAFLGALSFSDHRAVQESRLPTLDRVMSSKILAASPTWATLRPQSETNELNCRV